MPGSSRPPIRRRFGGKLEEALGSSVERQEEWAVGIVITSRNAPVKARITAIDYFDVDYGSP